MQTSNLVLWKEYWLAAVIALCGCTSVQIPVEDKKTLRSFSQDIQHKREYSIGDNNLLIAAWFNMDVRQFSAVKDESNTLILEVLATDKIKLTLNSNQQTLSRTFKGKIEGVVFKARNKIHIGPVPLVFWVFNSESNSFCEDTRGRLVVYHDHGGTIFIGIIPIFGTSVGQYRSVFEIKDE